MATEIDVPVVAFTGLEGNKWPEMFQSVGGGVTEHILEATHLVTDVKLKRTAKLLSAIARGLPIVSTKWIEACKKSSTFVDSTHFLIQDKEFGKKYGIDVVATCEAAKRSKLLHGVKLYAVPGGGKLSNEEFKELVECASGTVLIAAPKDNKGVTVISNSGNGATGPFIKKGFEVQTYEFLYNAILQQKLDHE